MKFYLILSFICYFYKSASTKIKPELKKNIFNFGYRINYKYEGMLAHSFDKILCSNKIYITFHRRVTISKLNYDSTCTYPDNKNTYNTETRKHILDLVTVCKKMEPFVIYYKRLIRSYKQLTIS